MLIATGTMLRDLRIGVRALIKWRWGAVVAVLTLAVGIGTTTALYALLRVALADSAVEIEEVGRVARIYGTNPALGVRRSAVTFDDFDVRLAGARSFESIAAYQPLEMTLGSGPDAATISVMRVSSRFFEVLRGRALQGRLLTPADRPDAAPVAVVGELTWRRRFAGRRIADAPSIRLNGREHAVIGVLPASFSFPMIGIAPDVWIPLARPSEDGGRISVISRLAPGVSWAAAWGELAALDPPLQQEGVWRWGGVPVEQDVRARTAGATAWIFLPAAVVLIIGCVNVACMLIARGMRRETELTVRMALGASRCAIFQQLFMENALLAIAAGVVGAALAVTGLDIVTRAALEAKPELATKLSGDLALLPIAITSSAVACVLFGLVPALRLSRRDVASSLKGSAPAPRVKVAGYGGRDLVVFLELGLAVVLVVMTAMSFTVIRALQDTEIGFAANELVTVDVPAADSAAAVDRVRAVSGVSDVALASAMPGSRGASAIASVPGGASAPASLVRAGQLFFEVVGLPLVRGRPFVSSETADAAVVIVSESAAAAWWPGQDPVGRQVDVAVRGRSTRLVVVGVAKNAIQTVMPRPQPPEIYRPLDVAAETNVLLLARSPRPKELWRQVGAAARPRDEIAAQRARGGGDIAASVAQGAMMIRLVGAFALIALLLAGSGIFAVVSQSVTQRTAEFGVRLALGATPWRVLRGVLARETKLIAAALGTATVGIVAMTRSSGFDDAAMIVAMNVSRPEWSIGLIGVCGAVAGLACLFATYRIVRLDPSAVLRRN